jgi:hypothetical protein
VRDTRFQVRVTVRSTLHFWHFDQQLTTIHSTNWLHPGFLNNDSSINKLPLPAYT